MSEIRRKKIMKSLQVPYTPEEIAAFKDSVIELVKQKQEKENQKKEVNSQYQADINTIQNNILTASEAVTKGYYYSDIECNEAKNFETGMISITRCDTGEEIMNRRMNANEMQMDMLQ